MSSSEKPTINLMKKLILFLILPLVISCEHKKEFPELINKAESMHSDKDYDQKNYQDFLVYENATTKNSKIPKGNVNVKNQYPWENSASKKRAEETLSEIENSIKAETDGASESNKNPSGSIYFTSLVNNYFTDQQLAEYKRSGNIQNENSPLDYLKAKVKTYDLTNEKNEKIKLDSDVLGINQGGLEDSNGKLLEGIAFETLGMGGSKYLTLKGFVEIEIEMPVGYDKVEVTKDDLGKKFSISGQKIQVLEFDANVFHYLLLDSDSKNFSIYVDPCNGNSSSVQIPESIYKKFRINQGLDYQSFMKKFKEFGVDKIKDAEEKNYVTILKSDDCQIDKIFLYSQTASNLVKKTIRVPVDIKIK